MHPRSHSLWVWEPGFKSRLPVPQAGFLSHTIHCISKMPYRTLPLRGEGPPATFTICPQSAWNTGQWTKLLSDFPCSGPRSLEMLLQGWRAACSRYPGLEGPELILLGSCVQTAHDAQQHQNKQTNQKMGRRNKQTFLQIRHTDRQEAHEKMFNAANYWRNANQNCNEVSPYTRQNSYHQKIHKQYMLERV